MMMMSLSCTDVADGRDRGRSAHVFTSAADSAACHYEGVMKS